MTHNRFWISDLHLGHEKTWSTFKKADGTPLRPFKSTEEMDETIIANWNKTVKDHDRVYLCGDVVIARRNMHMLGRLNGKITFIPGNHDIFKIEEYLPYVNEVKAVFVDVKRGLISAHIPLHPESLGRWKRMCHGHLHANNVKITIDGCEYLDPRYLNVSAEQTNFTPISLEEVEQRFAVLNAQRSSWPWDNQNGGVMM